MPHSGKLPLAIISDFQHFCTHMNTHQGSKSDYFEHTLHGEEGGKHYVQVG